MFNELFLAPLMEASHGSHPVVSRWLDDFSKHHSTHSRCLRSFKAIVGVHPFVIEQVWQKYIHQRTRWTVRDLMWTVSFLAVYSFSDIVQAGLWSVSDTTYTDIVWDMIVWLEQKMGEVCIVSESLLSLDLFRLSLQLLHSCHWTSCWV